MPIDKRYIIILVIGLVYSLWLSFHFFKPWYLWWLDYFFPLFWWIGEPWTNGFILWILTTLSKNIISSQILEKIILVLWFFIPFLWGALLLRRTNSIGAMVFAGIFLTCNPYFYGRFMDGQLGMYLLFCTIPFWIWGLYKFFAYKRIALSNYIMLIFLSIITTSISIHGALFLLVSFGVFACVYFDYSNSWNYIRKTVLVGFLILFANAYRIVPNLSDTNGAMERINQFDSQDLSIFQNSLWNANNYITTLTLQWYWWEWQYRFIPSYGPTQYPFFIFYFLGVIISIGIFYSLYNWDTRQRKLALCILVLTIVWYILWLGTAWETIFAWLTRFLYTYMPFYAAMRESHKWVLLMVIWYAYFGWYGIYALWKYFISKYSDILIGLSWVILVLGYTPSIFLLNKQIPVVDYPSEWYTLRNDLIELDRVNNDTDKRILVLPRHQHMTLWFVWKNVLNPVSTFLYPLEVIQWDNLEIWTIYSQGNDPLKNTISMHLWRLNDLWINKADDYNFLEYLRSNDIRYILLLKEVDYERYGPRILDFYSKAKLAKISNTDYFTLYHIQ